MKKSSFKTVRVLIMLFTLIGLWACQSDAPVESTTADTTASPAELSPAINTPDDTAQQTPDLNSLKQEYEQFYGKLTALQAEVNALPAATKGYATDFAELEARLEGYLGKGSDVQADLRHVAEPGVAEADGVSGDMASAKLAEIQTSLNDLNAVYKDLERAVEKLKAAKGPVRLFDDSSR